MILSEDYIDNRVMCCKKIFIRKKLSDLIDGAVGVVVYFLWKFMLPSRPNHWRRSWGWRRGVIYDTQDLVKGCQTQDFVDKL